MEAGNCKRQNGTLQIYCSCNFQTAIKSIKTEKRGCFEQPLFIPSYISNYFFISTMCVGACSALRFSVCFTTFSANSMNARPLMLFLIQSSGVPLSPFSQILCTMGICPNKTHSFLPPNCLAPFFSKIKYLFSGSSAGSKP